MCFADNGIAMTLDLSSLGENDLVKLLFAENTALVFQAKKESEGILKQAGVEFHKIGFVVESDELRLLNG